MMCVCSYDTDTRARRVFHTSVSNCGEFIIPGIWNEGVRVASGILFSLGSETPRKSALHSPSGEDWGWGWGGGLMPSANAEFILRSHTPSQARGGLWYGFLSKFPAAGKAVEHT